MIDKRFENGKRALGQQGLRRAHDIHIRNAEHLHRISAVTVHELLIYRIRSGVAHRMRGQSTLLPVQLHRVAEHAERPAWPRDLSGRQLRQLQQLQSLRQRLRVGLGARAAARHALRLLLLVGLVVVLRNAEHGEVSP